MKIRPEIFPSLLLVTCMLFSVTLPSFVLFSYHINQAEIIEKYCVNKDKPVMKCHGKCHLKDQLKKTEEPASEGKSTLPQVKEMNFHHWMPTSVTSMNFYFPEKEILPGFAFSGELPGHPLPSDPPPKLA